MTPLAGKTNMLPAPLRTVVQVDTRLALVSDQVRAHLNGAPTHMTWAACWQLADRLLDERNALTR